MKKYSLIFIALISILVISCKSEPKVKTVEERVAELVEKMKTTPEWMAELERKALEQGVLVDSIIAKDALWMIQKEDGLIPDEPVAPVEVGDTTNMVPESDTITVK